MTGFVAILVLLLIGKNAGIGGVVQLVSFFFFFFYLVLFYLNFLQFTDTTLTSLNFIKYFDGKDFDGANVLFVAIIIAIFSIMLMFCKLLFNRKGRVTQKKNV